MHVIMKIVSIFVLHKRISSQKGNQIIDPKFRVLRAQKDCLASGFPCQTYEIQFLTLRPGDLGYK